MDDYADDFEEYDSDEVTNLMLVTKISHQSKIKRLRKKINVAYLNRIRTAH